MQSVTIYTTKFCPYCIRAKQLLDRKNVEFNEIGVDLSPPLRREMSEKAGGAHTVPQIWIGDVYIGGCNELYELERQNKLDTLLKG